MVKKTSKDTELSPLSPTQRAFAQRRQPSDLQRKVNQGPVDTREEIDAQYYNPNSPVDSQHERKVRYDNPGPIDTDHERKQQIKDKIKTFKHEDKKPEADQNKPFTPNPFSTIPRPGSGS